MCLYMCLNLCKKEYMYSCNLTTYTIYILQFSKPILNSFGIQLVNDEAVLDVNALSASNSVQECAPLEWEIP